MKSNCYYQKKAIDADKLPPHFTESERYSYKWLRDCQIRGWVVDLLKKTVTAVDGNDVFTEHKSLVAFAETHGMELPTSQLHAGQEAQR